MSVNDNHAKAYVQFHYGSSQLSGQWLSNMSPLQGFNLLSVWLTRGFTPCYQYFAPTELVEQLLNRFVKARYRQHHHLRSMLNIIRLALEELVEHHLNHCVVARYREPHHLRNI